MKRAGCIAVAVLMGLLLLFMFLLTREVGRSVSEVQRAEKVARQYAEELLIAGRGLDRYVEVADPHLLQNAPVTDFSTLVKTINEKAGKPVSVLKTRIVGPRAPMAREDETGKYKSALIDIGLTCEKGFARVDFTMVQRPEGDWKIGKITLMEAGASKL